MKRVGILAGTFDPVHNGHLAFAEAALKYCRLDKIFFLIEPNPRRKQGVRAFNHRVKMVQLAVEGHSNLGILIIEQQKFTVNETLPYLLSRFQNTQLFLLFGDDVLEHITSWPHIRSLTEKVEFIIGSRRLSFDELTEIVESIKQTRAIKFLYQIIDNQTNAINSTRVRALLRQGKSSPDISPTVDEYIQRHNLYWPVSGSKL